jgi:6-phosphogluconolactonase
MSSGSGQLFVLRWAGHDGTLTPLQTLELRPLEGRGAACPIALSPDCRQLYLALRSEPYSAVSFAVDPADGTLTQRGEAPLPHSVPYLATDRSGRWLLAASYQGNLICVSPIDERGVAGAPAQVLPTPPSAHAILPDPANRFVINTSLGGDVVMSHHFDAGTGRLTQGPSVAVRAGSGPRHFRFHPNGRFLYLLCELDASLHVFADEAESGAMKEVQEVTALPPDFKGEHPAAADLHLSPDGALLYASVRASSTLAAFAVNAESGLLTPRGFTAVVTQPRGFVIDPTGRYLLAAGQVSHTLAVYVIDTSPGGLTLQRQYPMGRGPNWVEFASLG